MLTKKQRSLLLTLCDPIVLIGWCRFSRDDRSRNIIAGQLYRSGLVDRCGTIGAWEYSINDAGLSALQWEVNTANDTKRIAAIVGAA